MYNELITEFAGLPVVGFDDDAAWKGPDKAYRIREDYDDEVSVADRLDALLALPESAKLSALIIGAWSTVSEGNSSEKVVAKLVEIAPRLPNLRALFLGEMTYEESELSWINQSDVSPILQAFPKLEIFTIRGGTELAFSPVAHSSLRELTIETGGLPRSVLRELFLCDLPNLELLKLLLGESNYGFDGSVEDLQPLLSGKLYPRLHTLGLMNSEIADELAAVVVNAPIVDRIATLDLSMGNMTAEGIRSLHELASKKNLKLLDISHHFATEDEIAALTEALSCEVVAEDPQEPEDEWRPILHAE